MNNLKTTGLYVCGYNATNKPTSGVPYYVAVQKYTIGNQNVVRQIAGRAGINVVYERWFSDNVWGSWKFLLYDVPEFYKNYNSLSALIGAMDYNIIEENNQDISVLHQGPFRIANNTDTTKCPIEGVIMGLGVVTQYMNNAPRNGFQIAVNEGCNHLYIRTLWGSEWRTWREVTITNI